MSFRMKLALLPLEAGPFEPLSFATLRRGANAAANPFDPVLAATVGSELEYGNLFAYLFRRFGYPNQAWDHATELVRYLLTTPQRDLFLSVVPRVDGRTDLSIEFLAPVAAGHAAAAYARGAIDAWEGRAIMHCAARGMPPWLQERAQALRRPDGAATQWPEQAVEVWRKALRVTPADSDLHTRLVRAFFGQCQDAYARVEARPAALQRAAMPKDWDESDPLKPYALAATRALAGLTREVRVGANAIDVFGAKPKTSRALAETASVALGDGRLLNRQGARVGELLSLIDDLGQNDLRQGLTRAISVLRRARAS